MEWCNDANYFQDKIERRHTKIKNEDKLRSYAMDILTALQYIHNSNLIHADIKLPNILLQRPTQEEKESGELPMAKICDFGISQIIKSENGENKALMKDRSGTVGYIAPEIK